MENQIVNNQHHCGGFEINEFEIKEEVDEATRNVVQKREEMKRTKTAKLFIIKSIETEANRPMGYPLNPIRVLSIDHFQKRQSNSIHDVIADAMPSDEKLISAEVSGNSLKAMFDLINASKRLEAVEIGIRQLAEILKHNRCDNDVEGDVDSKRDDKKSKIENVKVAPNQCSFDPGMITSLQQQIDSLNIDIREMEKSKCKCSEDGFEESLLKETRDGMSQELNDALKLLQTEAENLKNVHQASFAVVTDDIMQFKETVCDRLDGYKNDFVECMAEIQEMMDAKLDKFFVPELKQYLQDTITALDEKIDNVDCKKAFAAGAVKKIIKDLNCVSCGDKVIQACEHNPTQSMLMCYQRNPGRNDGKDMKQRKSTMRLRGGSHTITTPNERIFRSECVKIKCHESFRFSDNRQEK